MARAPKKVDDVVIEVNEIELKEINFNVLGHSPLIMNRFNQKAWHELLFPSATKNRAEKESSMKHDPIAEFRGAVYRNRDPKTPTLIHMPTGAFHAALASAALDMPGATKAKIERLTRVTDVTIGLYGVPHVFCAMVRSSDIGRTPDVRTRPIFPEWCCQVKIEYVKSLLTERTISNLFAAAGLIIGVGDWRGGKGGSFGAWTNVGQDDARFKQIVAKQGRAAQTAALEKPIFYDQDTEELLTWFEAEVIRRERSLESNQVVGGKGKGKGKRAPKLPQVPVYTEDRNGNLLNGRQ